MTGIKKIGKFSAYPLENYLVLGLSKKWLKFFKDNPSFEVEINRNGRLILKGPIVTRNTHEK